jgi:hypothetical protein
MPMWIWTMTLIAKRMGDSAPPPSIREANQRTPARTGTPPIR